MAPEGRGGSVWVLRGKAGSAAWQRRPKERFASKMEKQNVNATVGGFKPN